jgi:hypothetical protein
LLIKGNLLSIIHQIARVFFGEIPKDFKSTEVLGPKNLETLNPTQLGIMKKNPGIPTLLSTHNSGNV